MYFKNFNKVALTMMIATNLMGDDYYCYNNPNTPECQIPVEILTDPSFTSSSAQGAFNSAYINQISSTGTIEAGSTNEGVVGGGSTGSSGGKGYGGSLSATNIYMDGYEVSALPLSLGLTDTLKLNLLVTYIKNTDTEQEGIGDSSIGIGYSAGKAYELGNFRSGLTLTMPTGDEEKDLSTEVHTLALGGGYSYEFLEQEAKLSIDVSYSSQVKMPRVGFNMGDIFDNDNILCSKDHYIEYGDKKMLSFAYNQGFFGVFSTNIKYIINEVEPTTISNVLQDDYAKYEDISFTLTSMLFETVKVTLGMVYPYKETYAKGLKDTVKERENSYIVSATLAF